MARLIIWSERALEDIESIAAYIAHDSEFYAASVVRTILQKSRRLSADEINVAAVIHGKRQLDISPKP